MEATTHLKANYGKAIGSQLVSGGGDVLTGTAGIVGAAIRTRLTSILTTYVLSVSTVLNGLGLFAVDVATLNKS